MKIGMSLPQLGPQASAENLIAVARRAEELGYDSLWVLERLLWPLNPQEPYPASPDGSLPATYQNVFDPIETLTFVAARYPMLATRAVIVTLSPSGAWLLLKLIPATVRSARFGTRAA